MRKAVKGVSEWAGVACACNSNPQEARVPRLLPGRALVHQELQIFTLETLAQPEVLAHMLRVATQVWMQDKRLGL